MGAAESSSACSDACNLTGICCLKNHVVQENGVERTRKPASKSSRRPSFKGSEVLEEASEAGSPNTHSTSSKSILTLDQFRKSLTDLAEIGDTRSPLRNSESFRSASLLTPHDASGKQRSWTSREYESLENSVKMAAAHLAIKPPNFFAAQVRFCVTIASRKQACSRYFFFQEIC